MAENEDGQEKSQEPTERKKEQAREEGKIVTSKEMFVFSSMAMGALMVALLQNTPTTIGGYFADYLIIAPGSDMDALLLQKIGQMWQHILLASLIVAVPVGVSVLLLQAAIGGIHFAPKALGFKGEKINPLKGLKRMVSKQALVDLLKSILKVLLLAAVAFGVLYGMLPHLDKLWMANAPVALSIILKDTALLLGALTIVLACIGGLDLAWQLYSMRESLMMTLKEVKDENKDTNGSPEIKAKLRQKQYEMSARGAKERAALQDVPSATTIVTNPTHFAVALRYIPGEMSAPVVVASGKGHMAKEIIRIGASAGVGAVRVPPLARALYFTTQIGMEIDERLFTAVATLLGYVYHVDRGYSGEMPDIDLPDEMMFNEFGRNEKGDE